MTVALPLAGNGATLVLRGADGQPSASEPTEFLAASTGVDGVNR
ncbi:MAG: hypothetical protein WAW17_12640 [Rhodococcus sp. (in: high G+C Gram-positive bacteria)]